MFGIFQMVLWLIGSLLDPFDPQKCWSLSGKGGGGLVSEFMWGIAGLYMEKIY